jgi:hypothetical protein
VITLTKLTFLKEYKDFTELLKKDLEVTALLKS